MLNIGKEREAFEAWAFQNIENFIDAQRYGNYYVMKPNSRLAHRDKEFLILSLNRGWASWQASALSAAEKLEGCVVVPTTPSYEMWSGEARHLGRYMQMHDRYCPKTLKKYFDRFIGDTPEWLNKEVKDWDSDHAFATADLPAFIYMSMVEAARGGR